MESDNVLIRCKDKMIFSEFVYPLYFKYLSKYGWHKEQIDVQKLIKIALVWHKKSIVKLSTQQAWCGIINTGACSPLSIYSLTSH